jgi:hypothetical protein
MPGDTRENAGTDFTTAGTTRFPARAAADQEANTARRNLLG